MGRGNGEPKEPETKKPEAPGRISIRTTEPSSRKQDTLQKKPQVEQTAGSGAGTPPTGKHIDSLTPPEPPAADALDGISQEEKLNALYRMTTSLAQQMEKSRISEYTELLYSPFKLIWLNILSGAARGLGIALGFTFFAATIIYILQVLGALNLPIIGDYIADIVRIVQHQLELKTF